MKGGRKAMKEGRKPGKKTIKENRKDDNEGNEKK